MSLNPSIYNILHWVAWTMGQTNRQPRVWCSKYYFFYTFYRLRALKTLYFYFCNFIKKNKKINWKDFCKEFCEKSWKKIIFGTSDAWSAICLSHRPSNPAYYIVNWRISECPTWYLNLEQTLIFSVHSSEVHEVPILPHMTFSFLIQNQLVQSPKIWTYMCTHVLKLA